MQLTRFRPFAVAAAALLSLLTLLPVQGQSPVSSIAPDPMFAKIAKDTDWDMSRDMLWGYFFTHPTRQPLESVSKELAASGYRVVDIYLSDKDQPTDPDTWWLHVERVEIHTPASLDKRNHELRAFAKKHGLGSYDGMDVGPVGAK